MPVIATEGSFDRFGSLVKMSDTPEKFEFHTQLIVANEAAGTPTYSLGTVLGKITASGKYIISKQAAVDGSQTPAVIVLADSFGTVQPVVLVNTVDTKFVALARGKVVVAREALKLDASFGTATQKQFAYDSLAAVGILVEAAN
jgi:hypothetical protein